MKNDSNLGQKIARFRSQYWGKIPKSYSALENIQFKKFGRRTNWGAANSLLFLKSGACSKTLFFSLFARTLEANAGLFKDIDNTTILWSERNSVESEKNIIAEHGWLPRIAYQISPKGANARSHIRFDSSNNYIDQLGQNNLDRCKLRAQHFVRPKHIEHSGVTDQPFCLIPLQGGEDYNLKFSDSGFDHIYGQENANDKIAQALIEKSHAEANGIRLVVTEHPAKKCRLSQAPKCPDNMIFINASQGIRSIDLAAHKNCIGITSVNSNLIHEAMLFNKPICSYGNLMYRKEDNPTFSSITEMLEADGNHQSRLDQYLAMLFLYQWEVSDLMDPIMLRALLMDPEKAIPWELRNNPVAFDEI